MTTTSGDVWERVTVTSLRRHDPHQLLTVGARFLAPSQPWFPGSRGLHSSARWRGADAVIMGGWTALERRERLHAARLYLVTGSRPGGRSLAEVLEPALRGGVDLVQLRAKDAGDEEILAAAAEARPLCAAAGALLLVNDRPGPRGRRRRRRRPRRAGRHDGRGRPRDHRPGAAGRAVDPRALGDRRGGRGLHRRRAGARDADEAGAPRRRPRPRALRGRARRAAVVRDRRRSTPRPSARSSRRARRGSPSSARSPTPTTPRRAASALRAALPREVAHGRP